MSQYEVWNGDEYIGIYWENELSFIAEEILGYRAISLDD